MYGINVSLYQNEVTWCCVLRLKYFDYAAISLISILIDARLINLIVTTKLMS